MKRLRVLLADDHNMVRAGLRLLLDGLDGARVVAEAKDGREALRLIRDKRPDILLTDISMPGMNGLAALAVIRKKFPGVRAVVLSVHEDEEYVRAAMEAGAAGYLLKKSTPAELEQCLHAVAKGGTYFTPLVSKSFLEYRRRPPGGAPASGESPFHKLTPRQREVLQLIAEGHTSRQIAGILRIDVKTVETHRMNLMKRLDLHDVASLTRYAMQKGLITQD